VAIAVLIVGALLLYRLRADLRYAMQSETAQDLGNVSIAAARGDASQGPQQSPQQWIEKHVALSGLPDHRSALAFDPKGGRMRQLVFRLLGTSSRIYVTTPVSSSPPFVDHFSGRLRRLDDLSYGETLRTTWQSMQALRAVDLNKLRALPPGALPSPFVTTDRAGEALRINAQQDLLIDVLFEDDLRVLLSKDKFPSEGDARHEVERLGLLHGPGVETKDGYGYVLRLPPKGPVRQQLLAQIDAQGIWLWHRIETFRVPATAVQVTPAGLALPGPDVLPQPIRYQEQVPPDAAPNAPRQLLPQKEPNTLLLWEQVQAVQVSEPLTVPADALLLVDGEAPKALFYVLPLAALL
jgi:hypothetical protein